MHKIYDLRFWILDFGLKMDPEEAIKLRTKAIGLTVIKMSSEIPNSIVGRTIYGQLLRCASSVGANYRSACRGKSTPDFLNKLKIVEEESDETLYWLELLEERDTLKNERISNLKKEVDEILSIMVASIKTIRSKMNKQSTSNRKS